MTQKKILYEGQFKRFIKEQEWEYTERTRGNGVVVIIAVTEDKKLIFVEQFRVPVGRPVIELPAGISNDSGQGETLEDAARRELLEETGYQAEKMVLITEGPSSSASVSDVLSLYRAYGITKVAAGGGDDLEDIKVHEVPCDGIEGWFAKARARGCYIDPKIYAALYLIKNDNHHNPK